MTPLIRGIAIFAAIALLADGVIRLAALAEARADYLSRVMPAVEALTGLALLVALL